MSRHGIAQQQGASSKTRSTKVVGKDVQWQAVADFLSSLAVCLVRQDADNLMLAVVYSQVHSEQ